MRRCFPALLVTVLFFSTFASADVLKLVLDDTIQAATAERVERALDHAAVIKADAVVIEMSTPGGVMSSMREIMQAIVASPVPVIIYVTPSGSRAASAGFFILESADVAAMAPGTNTGSAHPVGPFGGDIQGAMGEKVMNDAAALMRSFVSKRGRNIDVAESTVRQSKSFTENEALSQKLIDYVAKDEQDLFRQMAGKPIKRFNGETITLNLVGKPEQVLQPTLKEQILSFLMEPDIAFILLAIGALALYAEFNHPGAVWPGTVGIVFIVLAIFA
jgi:membrane-bound serine protease (ClpP class)